MELSLTEQSKRKRRKSTGSEESDYTWVEYLEYKVIIQSEEGKNMKLQQKRMTPYQYYKVGDRVRHHGGLNSYEKYDKSNDSIIFCAACATLNQMEDDKCHRCNCPLLK